MTADDLAALLEAVPLCTEVLVLAPNRLNRAYRIVSARVINPRIRQGRSVRLYLVLDTEGQSVSRQQLLRRRPFRP